LAFGGVEVQVEAEGKLKAVDFFVSFFIKKKESQLSPVVPF
jgi:hypothetical protein